MASDLDSKYPVLASKILGVPLGMGSFLHADQFVKARSKVGFFTDLSKPLRYRDGDLDELMSKLGSADVTLIHGRSGCGKTKVALEVCKRFCEAENWDFVVLDSAYSCNVDEDAELILGEAERIVVLVDDANDQMSLVHLLSLCSRNPGLKLVMTVRNLAKSSLLRKVQQHAKPKVHELEPLAGGRVDSILEDEYGIKNSLLRERISKVAAGNLRIAIMAAVSVTEGNGDALKEPYDLLDSYMANILEDRYTDREQMALEVLSVYGTCDLEDGDGCYERLKALKYGRVELETLFDRLHGEEVVTKLMSSDGVVAVRMEEQNLCDYLVCRYFVKKRREGFAEFAAGCADAGSELHVRAARSLIEVCGSAEVSSFLEREVEKAWRKLDGREIDAKDSFMMSFCRLLPPATALMYARERMGTRPPRDVSERILNSNWSSDDSLVLVVASAFMADGKCWQAALELYADFIDRGSEEPSCYRWACGHDGAFSDEQGSVGFDIEVRKLRALEQRYLDTGSDNVAACLVVLAAALLDSVAVQTEPAGTGFSMRRITYSPTAALAQLHVECFRALACLLDSDHRGRAMETFRRKFRYANDVADDEEREHGYAVLRGMGDLAHRYTDEDSTENLACCESIDALFAARGASSPIDPSVFSQATKDALALERRFDVLHPGDQVDFLSWSDDRLTSALDRLLEDCGADGTGWVAYQAVLGMVDAVYLRDDRNCTIGLIERIGGSMCGMRLVPVPVDVLRAVCDDMGRGHVRGRMEYAAQGEAGIAILDEIDRHALRNSPTDAELKGMVDRLGDGRLHLSFGDVLLGEEALPGFAAEYTRCFLSCCECDDAVARYFQDCDDPGLLDKTEVAFSANVGVLENAYLRAMRDSAFDHSLSLLLRIADMDGAFPSELSHCILGVGYKEMRDFGLRLSRLWTCGDERGWPLLKGIVLDALKNPSGQFVLHALIPRHDSEAMRSELFWERTEELVSLCIGDPKKMGAISLGFGDCDDEARLRFLKLAMTRDVDGLLLGCLWLRRSTMGGNCETGFTVAKRQEVALLGRLAEELPQDSAYLKHRAHIEQVQQSIIDDIGREKWDLFHGKW